MTLYNGHHVTFYTVTYYNNDSIDGFAGTKTFTVKNAAERYINSEVAELEKQGWHQYDNGWVGIALRNTTDDDYTTYEFVLSEHKHTYFRECTNCDSPMNEGYCIENGMEYYCSDKCLHKHYTPEEWDEMYAEGEGDSYWTEWEEGEDENEA